MHSFDLSEYQEKKSPAHQLRHVNSTPLVLNHLQQTINDATQHLFTQLDRAARELERQSEEIKLLKTLLKRHGIPVPPSKKC